MGAPSLTGRIKDFNAAGRRVAGISVGCDMMLGAFFGDPSGCPRGALEYGGTRVETGGPHRLCQCFRQEELVIWTRAWGRETPGEDLEESGEVRIRVEMTGLLTAWMKSCMTPCMGKEGPGS